METKNKKKSNKSSIVRVIISNFDNKEVKEIKILYNKRAGVDVIKLKSTERLPDNRMKFNVEKVYNVKDADEIQLNEDDEFFKVDLNEDGTLVKIRKLSRRKKDKIIKDYEISGNYRETNGKGLVVEVKIEDKLESTEKHRSGKSETKRLLLSDETINNYRQLISSSEEVFSNSTVIDSEEIYKINKFLSYRSSMMMYFNTIEKFLREKESSMELKKEIYTLADDEEFIDSTVIKVKENMAIFIENYNNRIENGDSSVGEDEKISLSDEEIRKDTKKAILLLGSLRHKLAHFDYEFFKCLYSGQDIDMSLGKGKEKRNTRLSELLELNFFYQLEKINIFKSMEMTNYLDDNSQIFVLGKTYEAKKSLYFYDNLNDYKSGFNNFINSMLVDSGEEDLEFKNTIREEFNQGIKRLEASVKKGAKRNEKLFREQVAINKLEGISKPYEYDIHDSRLYKKLYVERKEKVLEYSKLIEKKETDGKKNADLNKEIAELNREMKNITKTNSKYRLQYKLQMAFGFLKEEYDLNIEKFKNDFNKDDQEKIDYYLTKREIYLKAYFKSDEKEKSKKFKEMLKESKKENIFSKENKNNLVKLYILIYLLLAKELKGSFLGFVKKNYYDLKHVDFIEKNDGEERDDFFHQLRLFEKNSRKLEIINYSLVNEGLFDLIEKEILGDYPILKLDDDLKKNCSKKIIAPLISYFEIIFKLFNDIEIMAMFKAAYEDEKDKTNGRPPNYNYFKKGIGLGIQGGYFNFGRILKRISDGEYVNYQLRNYLAHNNIKNLYDAIFKSCKSIDENMEELIEFCVDKKLLYYSLKEDPSDYLSRNYLNDYYKKKEQMIYNLQKREFEDKVTIEKFNREKENNRVISKYKLDKPCENKEDKGPKFDLEKAFEIKNNLSDELRVNNEKISNKRDSKEFGKDFKKLQKKRTELKGDLKIITMMWNEEINKMSNDYILGIIKKNEKRIINVEIFEKNEGDAKKATIYYEQVKFRRMDSTNEFEVVFNSNNKLKVNLDGNIATITCEGDSYVKEVNLNEKYIRKIKFKIKK